MGAVYLLHFDQELGKGINPLAHAQHYLGFAPDGDVDERFKKHISEGLRLIKLGAIRCAGKRSNRKGSPLVASAIAQGINVRIVRVWKDSDRALERNLKGRKNARQLCPICSEEHRRKARERMRKIRAKKREQKNQLKLPFDNSQ